MDFLNHYVLIVILAIVEGVTEFLPISSTGHLFIAKNFLHTREPDLFDVALQAGAILAVLFVYWQKIMDLLGNLDKTEARQYLVKLVAAFLVTSIVSLLVMKHFHFHVAETLTSVAWAILIGGLVIFAIELLAQNLYPHEDVSWPEAIMMGLAQVLAAVFPGASRPGATIVTGLAMGMRRPSATDFSFLLGIPTMLAACALDLWQDRKDFMSGDHQLILDIAIGFFVSTIVAFFVLKWFLRFVQSHSFHGFALYRVILGGGLLIAISLNPSLAQIGTDEAFQVAPAIQSQPAPEAAPQPPPVPPASSPTNQTITDSPPITNAVTATTNLPTEPSTSPRALPVNPADLTNVVPATNVTILPPPPSTNSAP